PDWRPERRHRGSNGRRASVDRCGGASGYLVDRQESAACPYPDDGSDRRPAAVNVVAKHGGPERICSARAATRIAGPLRSAVVRRHTAHQRDRRPHGVRRDVRRDTTLLWQTRLAADALWLAIGLAL